MMIFGVCFVLYLLNESLLKSEKNISKFINKLLIENLLCILG